MRRTLVFGVLLVSLALLPAIAVASGRKDADATYGCDEPGLRTGDDVTQAIAIDRQISLSPRNHGLWIDAGTIVFTSVVGCDGKLHDLELVRGEVPESLETGLRRMLGKWRFEPGHAGGKPVATQRNVILRNSSRENENETPQPGVEVQGTKPADEYGCRPSATGDREPVIPPMRINGSGSLLSRRELKQWGPIEISGTIGCDGRMHDLEIDKELPEKLDAKLRRQIDEWRYEPATVAGEPFKVEYSATLKRPEG